MTLRSPRERIIQSLAYETCGLCFSIPLYLAYNGAAAGGDPAGAAGLMMALSMAALIWAPLHNILFDLADLRMTGRCACARPLGWRLAHALSLEASTLTLTVPLLVVLGGHGWGEALLLDLGLTLAYVCYAYLFHLTYDKLRPIGASAMRPFCLAS
jgi:uncharacterized membrane protein